MPFAAALSNRPSLKSAVDEASQEIVAALGGQAPDLACVFVSHHFSNRFGEVADQLQFALGSRVLIGCTGDSIVGGSMECEDEPALSIWCAILPGATLVPFQLSFEQTPDGLLCSGLPDDMVEHHAETRAVLFLGEPYSSLPQAVLDLLADELPGVPVVGGMASGGAAAGENRLFLNDQMVESGAIGVIVRGGPRVRTIVSQGCRPIGTTYVVTRAERNIIYELGGVPPLERLKELFPKLPPRDQQLVDNGVHLGVVMNEYQESFQRGDFLIVNVHGADRNTGALATGGLMRVGQTVQFHIRDADTADEDLRQLLQRDADQTARHRGALLFSCNGRGTRMFSVMNHDASAIQEILGPLPLAGFFAQGELGPVGNKNYIHGFTASIVVFEED